ncbi:MAG TPA: acyl-CoA thioesterase [Gemmatimonadaceae bacterium]|nr:acyl-CoA thioesterase [Gemmatimonadaceae bacterium]
MPRRAVPLALAAAAALAPAACRPADRAPKPPRAEFIMEAGDSSFWIRSGPEGVRMRGVPMRISRIDGRFDELYVADDDHSYPDAIITGQRLYRRDLSTGDSTLVFDDTLVAGVARWYLRDHPTAVPLGPDDDLPDEPDVNATSDLQLLAQYGRFLSMSYSATIQLGEGDEQRLTRSYVLDLRAGHPAAIADIIGDRNAEYVIRKGESLFRQAVDSVLASPDQRARAAAAALGGFRFDSTSFELVMHDGGPAIRFVAPGSGDRAAGLTLPLAPIPVAPPSWWPASLAGIADPDSDAARDHWKKGAYTVWVDYAGDSEPARVSLADSAGRRFPVGAVPAPARRIYWLDGTDVDSATRAALSRAFDEAALYSEDTRTAMSPSPKKPELAGKPVKDSQNEMSELMMPQDANNLGHVFGGVVLSMMDRCAAVSAIRHTRSACVTVSVDRVDFREPIHLGELVTMKSSVNYTGRTSLEIGIRVDCENLTTGVRRHTNSCYMTFVAVDGNGRPIPVPPVIPETPLEKRRYAAAAERRRRRLEERTAEGEHA